MAETAEGKNQNGKVNPEAKYMRLQEIGLSMILAVPVALAAGETFGIVRASIIKVCVLLFYIGFALFVLGHEKRVELRNKEDS